MQDERRKYIRLANDSVLWCRKYSLMGTSESEIEAVASKVKDISAGGALFETRENYTLGDLVKLEIDIPGWEKYKAEFFKGDHVTRNEPVVILAKVVRVEIIHSGELYDIGVVFAGIDDGHQWALLKYIRKESGKK